jgi:alkylation response protein AidB-like acyl-CoA dehydrogenase
VASTAEDRALLIEAIRDLAQREIAPLAAEVDAEGRFPHEWVEAFRDHGVFALAFDEEHGGTGTGTLLKLQAIEEISKVDATAGLLLAVQDLAALPVRLAGTPEQRARWEPAWASGECLAAYALTEPEAGSDSAAMRTTARRDGDGYVLNGGKRFITNAGVAGTYAVFAKTDPEAGHAGVSAFIVEAGDEGFSVGKLEHKMGIRGSTTGEIFFDDLRLPGDRLVGLEGEGFRLAMRVLDRSRPGIAAQALGLAQGAIDHALAYARERQAFGKPIAAQQGIQFMLADMQTRTEGARLLLYRVAEMIDADVPPPELTRFSAMCKLLCSDVAMDVTTDAVQILGGYGYVSEYPVERMMRDAKITQIYEGTNQIQRLVIARELLAGR